MKYPWLAYVMVAFVSIGAGVAIAGMPNNVPIDATVVPPTTTEVPTPTVPESTVPTTTEPEVVETTEPETTVSVQVPERAEIIVGVANGAGIAGAAARTVMRLTELGYVDLIALDGTEVVQLTTVYYADGFEQAALQMANDLELLSESIAPLAEAPEIADLAVDTQLLAYVGADLAR